MTLDDELEKIKIIVPENQTGGTKKEQVYILSGSLFL